MNSLIILDLDGTLVDSEYEIAAITADLAQSRGCSLDAQTAFCQYAGMSFKDRFNNIANAFGRSFSSEDLSQAHKEYQRRKEEMYARPDLPMIQGARSLITRLAANHAITLSVGSSNETTRTNRVLSALSLSHYFGSRVYGSDMAAGKKKPDPSIFQLAMRGYDPARTLILEDSIPGIMAARSAGAFVVAHLDPRISKQCKGLEQAFRDAGADVIITNYDDFETIVGASWQGWPRSSRDLAL